MIISALKDIYKKINSKAVHGVDEERMPYNMQMEYLKHFSEPRDDFERSYYKYKCFCEYCYYKRKWIVVIYNIGAMLILPFVHSKLRKANRSDIQIEKVDAVIENVPRLPNVDVIPDELVNRFGSVKEINHIDYSESFLSDRAEDIYQELKRRYYFKFYFRMIVMQKLGQFSRYLECYGPEALVFYSCEREFSGPLQSLLCERCDAQYISFMHGDYLSTLSFAFQRYSSYYVWDESYKKMFDELKCASPMLLYKPKKLKGIATSIAAKKCTYFATYYFSDETREEAVKIYEIFKEFEEFGLRTKIRPHPRFSDITMLNEIFNDIEIEKPKSCVLGDSITKSLYIVGLNTTVLSEAFFSNKEIVIDDISNPEKYMQLDLRGYVMIKRPHILLSELRGKLYKQYENKYAFFKQYDKSAT